jgi:hypothetical protein
MAGNIAKASRIVEMRKTLAKVDLVLERNDEEVTLGLEYNGKVPLRYWRLEMWTREGKILTQSEGVDLPVKIGVELPDSDSIEGQEIKGFLFYEDIFGAESRRKIEELLPELKKKPKTKGQGEEKSPAGISEKWVDDF